MTLDDDSGRYATKRDRLARLARLVSILQAHPEGIRTADIATRVGMSVRTVYRDLTALQDELRLPVWGEDGVWGIDCGQGVPAAAQADPAARRWPSSCRPG